MKIGLAVGYFDPQVGGSEEVVKQLAAELARRGHQVRVATSTHPEREPGRMVVPVDEFDVRGNVAQGLKGDVLGYQRHLLESDVDAWLFYAAQVWSTDAALPLFGRIPPAVVVPCGYSGLHLPQFREYYDRLPSFLQRAAALVYMSDGYQDYTHDRSVGLADRMHVIPNGAAESEFAGGTTPPPPDGGRLVLTVANHYPDKGHDAAIRAFRVAAGPRDRLLIVGDVHDRDPRRTCWWSCRASALRDRRITLATGMPREKVVASFRQASVFLFGSRVECAPLVIIEAMAAGIPFVTTPAGNVRDYPDAGLVTDEARLGEALRSILDDPVTAAALGARGRSRWERDHQWSVVARQYEELFRQICSES